MRLCSPAVTNMRCFPLESAIFGPPTAAHIKFASYIGATHWPKGLAC